MRMGHGMCCGRVLLTVPLIHVSHAWTSITASATTLVDHMASARMAASAIAALARRVLGGCIAPIVNLDIGAWLAQLVP